jgi:hypothetical protein
MNLHVTGRAISVLRVLIMLRSGRLNRADVMRHTVTGQTELIDCGVSQQSRVRGSMRRVTGNAPFGLYRGMFKSKRALLVRVALNTTGITTGGQPGLLEFESTMRVMAISAHHGPLKNLMMKRRRERRLDLAVATQTELRVVRFQQLETRKARLFTVRGFDEGV